MHYLTDILGASASSGTVASFFKSLTLGKLVPAVLTLVIGLVVIRLAMKLFEKTLERSKLEKAAYGMLRGGMRILLYAILVLVVVSGLGVDVTSLVAILSVVSLALSLAVQGALTNLVGGITLLSTHPFKSGDYVDIGGQSGTVHEVGLAYTKLMTPDNKIISIPNSIASTAEITNYSTAKNRRVDITVSASYTSSTEAVKKALFRAANVPQTLFTPEPFVGIQTYGDSAITYVLRVWTAAEDYWDAYFAINENIRKEFDEAGVIMTYPHLNVHLDKA